MKIFNIKNMADILPNYKENKIVLFDNNPTMHSENYNLKTNAKLWYHFAPDTMLSPKYLREKGAVETSDGVQAVRNLQGMLSHPELWTNIEDIFVTPFAMGSLGIIQDPLNENEIIVLMPYFYQHPMGGVSTITGYVGQSLPVEVIEDDKMFNTYCTECFGIFDNELKLNFRSILHSFLVSPQYTNLLK